MIGYYQESHGQMFAAVFLSSGFSMFRYLQPSITKLSILGYESFLITSNMENDILCNNAWLRNVDKLICRMHTGRTWSYITAISCLLRSMGGGATEGTTTYRVVWLEFNALFSTERKRRWGEANMNELGCDFVLLHTRYRHLVLQHARAMSIPK